MSIRLRIIPGVGVVALCAARSVPNPGDVYLDDAEHHALSVKFSDDFAMEGRMAVTRVAPGHPDWLILEAMGREESNNPNREEWDRVFDAAELNGVDADLKPIVAARDAAAREADVRQEEAVPSALRALLHVGETEAGEWGLWCIPANIPPEMEERIPYLYGREAEEGIESELQESGVEQWGPGVDAMWAEFVRATRPNKSPTELKDTE